MERTFLRRPRAGRSDGAVLALAVLLLGGCASLQDGAQRLATLGGAISPYRMDILQGNVVVREQVEALQPGMPRQQVQAILGTPLVASIFHADRWDYVFTFQRQGQPPQRRVVSVFFEGERLARVHADGELPSEREFVASLPVRRPAGKPPVLEADEAQLRAAQGRAPAAAAPAAAQPPAPAATAYPPLEAR
ncbi:Outer membrane protein assembly factor BamE [Tepidimonas sediminis]|uniref:Outer membrane protein assembly factor BamE n=1 Tax=Tepidimonas sediminis TaxID=2588941 RepID=A0A554WMT6_9BURK|nr:outer membrane protein assembly factor BamE [Tepidimonas sediminis]TSE24885.1 Outer membrane protein assembly factor BamE [Tepidimonas sediminis]